MTNRSPTGDGEVFPTLKVAAIQMACRVGEKDTNLRVAARMIETAANEGASLIVLPELASSGYVFASREEAFSLAEPVPDGESTRAWIELARRHHVHIVAGVAERDGNRLYNAAVLVGPHGLLGTYRKLHLWHDEHLFFESGDLGLPVFDTEIGRIAAVICYDGWFPEVYRLLAMKGADVVCMPTNWVPMPAQRPDAMAMANLLAIASAHSNGLNLICADRIGDERGQAFIGRSVIVGSDGWPLAGPASPDLEEILYADLNLRTSRRSRQLNAFNHVLRDRRDDVYDPMLGTGWPLPRH